MAKWNTNNGATGTNLNKRQRQMRKSIKKNPTRITRSNPLPPAGTKVLSKKSQKRQDKLKRFQQLEMGIAVEREMKDVDAATPFKEAKSVAKVAKEDRMATD